MNKLALGAIVAGLTYLVLLFAIPLVRFRPWFKWWDDHQPKGGEKQHCMPMALLAYQSSAAFLYSIAGLFMIKENQKLQYDWQAEFLLRVMGRWGVDVADPGFLTPLGLCTTIAPQIGEPFYKANKPRVQGNGDSWPSFTGWPQDLPPEVLKKYSLRMLWTGVFSSWGCKAGATKDTIDPDALKSWPLDPSNFLYKLYAIPGDASICASFVLNTHADKDGNLWFPLAMTTMLGVDTESGAGGWVGLLRAGGDWGDYGLINMESFIWSHNVSSLPAPKSPLKTCGVAGAASAAMQGLNLGAMGAMAMAGLTEGPVGMIVGGLVGLFGGGLLGAAQYKCL